MKSQENYKSNKLIDYFGLKIPLWMESRKSILIFIMLDYIFIFYILYNNLLNKNSQINRIFFLSIIWCSISYIYGRYSYLTDFQSKFEKLINLIYKSSISIILLFTVDKLGIIFNGHWNSIGKNNIFLILFCSTFIQSIKFIYPNNYFKKNCIYLLGNAEEISFFKKQSRGYFKTNNYKFKKFTKNSIDSFGYKTIIYLGHDYKRFLMENLKLISKNTEIYNPSKWFEKKFQVIPSIFLQSNDFELNKLILKTQSFNWRFKRISDFILGLLILLISLPVILIAAIFIKIEDNGPIFYSQLRTGLYGKKIRIIKIRSMRINAEENGPKWAQKDDPRITKVGYLLRKTRIDELPQLLSVIMGDMSLIGPRPERPEMETKLIKKIPYYRYRNLLKPGLSGWAQVNYKYGSSEKDAERKLSYELFYLKNQSLMLDLLILIKTIKLILNLEGSDQK